MSEYNKEVCDLRHKNTDEKLVAIYGLCKEISDDLKNNYVKKEEVSLVYKSITIASMIFGVVIGWFGYKIGG